jgi:predicted GNAT superfamily acetyltransferase
LSQFLAAGAEVINPARINEQGWPAPAELVKFPEALERGEEVPVLLLVEVPADFQELKRNDVELARGWRMHSRMVFEKLFEDGYLVTDFVYMPGKEPRSYYVMTHGEATL